MIIPEILNLLLIYFFVYLPTYLSTICSSDRLKYLLSQSDIFSHFGVGGGKGGKAAANTPSEAAAASSSSSSSSSAGVKRGRRSNNALNNMDEMDDDERAMAKEEDDDDGGNGQPKGTVLLRQPSCISGGAMR